MIPSAVIGLYPMANQGLLRDQRSCRRGRRGPIESFVRVGVSLDASTADADENAEVVQKRKRDFTTERLVTVADPCQARAVHLARASRGLVVHGPPGTGKSQTIANIIGDHLARGERVLFVCDKRTALDVVDEPPRRHGPAAAVRRRARPATRPTRILQIDSRTTRCACPS
ncbi:MAG: hypothetical protein QM702_03580 [Rubrivivax sp.]